jgi:hypothetical protein
MTAILHNNKTSMAQRTTIYNVVYIVDSPDEWLLWVRSDIYGFGLRQYFYKKDEFTTVELK